MVAYWDSLFARPDHQQGSEGLKNSVSDFDFAKEGVLQRISAPTLVINRTQAAENTQAYQKLIPNSRLVLIESDGYHIAAMSPQECLDATMKFLRDLER